MKNGTLKILGFTLGVLTIVGGAAYQHEMMRSEINGLESDLQQAKKTIANQQTTIQNSEKVLREREGEVKRKEEQLQDKERQIQSQRSQLQAQKEELDSQKAAIVEQKEIAARLRSNTETLGVCLSGVSLAIIATTPFEAATALNAIAAKCEEASDIVQNL